MSKPIPLKIRFKPSGTQVRCNKCPIQKICNNIKLILSDGTRVCLLELAVAHAIKMETSPAPPKMEAIG